MLYEYLAAYCEGGPYPMHMPGHKRNPAFEMVNPYTIDVTEVEGLDNLHCPAGIIREFMNRMKDFYKTEETYLLVGGSTCGILSAVSACCRKGDVVVMDRGCHGSVYHAVCLLGLRPVYLMPEIEAETGISLGVSPDEVKRKIKQALHAAPGTKPGAVIITSPTYEGVVSDIEKIAEIAHGNEIPLIVDEAHGAHFPWAHGMVNKMPVSAISGGADIVIQSLHKTLPALTQTALLHLHTKRVSRGEIERWLDVFETSSPSYVLMASADQCLSYLWRQGRPAFSELGKKLDAFYDLAGKWKLFSLWEHAGKDPAKLVIRTEGSGLSGPQLGKLLRDEYQLEIEMEASSYVIAICSVADSGEGLTHLASAIQDIERRLSGKGRRADDVPAAVFGGYGKHVDAGQEICMDAYEAMTGQSIPVPIAESIGRISAEYAMIYPPGVPFLVPGERITETVIRYFSEAEKYSLVLTGLMDKEGKNIRVL